MRLGPAPEKDNFSTPGTTASGPASGLETNVSERNTDVMQGFHVYLLHVGNLLDFSIISLGSISITG
jgi:hypothetical protein